MPATQKPNKKTSTRTPGIDSKIRIAIRDAGPGAVFAPTEFLKLGNRAAVDKILSRLTAEGTLHRIGRGLYHYPKVHAKLGTLSPTLENIAQTIAERYSITLLPSGAQAANLLHLSEQVPAKAVYLTDGPTRTFHIGKQELTLKHAEPRRLKSAEGREGLVREALRFIGKQNVDENRINHLRKLLPAIEREALLRDLALAPAWMHPHLHFIAGKSQ